MSSDQSDSARHRFVRQLRPPPPQKTATLAWASAPASTILTNLTPPPADDSHPWLNLLTQTMTGLHPTTILDCNLILPLLLPNPPTLPDTTWPLANPTPYAPPTEANATTLTSYTSTDSAWLYYKPLMGNASVTKKFEARGNALEVDNILKTDGGGRKVSSKVGSVSKNSQAAVRPNPNKINPAKQITNLRKQTVSNPNSNTTNSSQTITTSNLSVGLLQRGKKRKGMKMMDTSEVQQKLTGTAESNFQQGRGFGVSSPPPKKIRLPPGPSVDPSSAAAVPVANVATGKGYNDSVKSPITSSLLPDPPIELTRGVLSAEQLQKKAAPIDEFGMRLAALQNANNAAVPPVQQEVTVPPPQEMMTSECKTILERSNILASPDRSKIVSFFATSKTESGSKERYKLHEERRTTDTGAVEKVVEYLEVENGGGFRKLRKVKVVKD